MTTEEILKVNKDLVKLTPSILSQVLFEKFGLEFNANKTWQEMGLDDDLDCIEYVMELEKLLDIQIDDWLIEIIFGSNQKPISFIDEYRNQKLNQLGI
jgi:acyl carrier protein